MGRLVEVSARPVKRLRLGFLALNDAAPLVAAQACGFFARRGLAVSLSREVGWATVRDKLLHGELEAAQAPAPMLWAAQLGLKGAPFPVCTALVLSLHGNAITLSTALRQAGVTDTASLRTEALSRRGERRLTLGVVDLYSTHHLLLHSWLRSARLVPGKDVRIAVVPPAQMFRNLSAGTIDGYCVGEPWNSLAVNAGAGWCPVWSSMLAPGHVEKVLMVRNRFAETRATEHAALVAALAEAAAWCDAPENRPALASMLASPAFLNLPENVITPGLTGRFDAGAGAIESVPDFHIFHHGGANRPTPERALTIQRELVEFGLVPRAAATPELPGMLFREDLFREAMGDSRTAAVVSTGGDAVPGA